MEREAVQPLRILKGNSNSPSKMPGPLGSRPLSEINPMGIRRNSGNTNAISPQLQKQDTKRDSSPFDPSPGSNSKLAFWRSQEVANMSPIGNENAPFQQPSSSPTRRSSIENLKKASRVHNNIFARDHDQELDVHTAYPMEKQLGRGRPLGARPDKITNTPTITAGSTGVLPGPFRGMGELETRIPWLGRASPPKWSPSRPPPKEQQSPQKSSLSSSSRHAAATQFDTVMTPLADDEDGEYLGHATTPRPVARHPKSVSFDIAPPQINEYEDVTPAPSSVESGSREGSYESDVYDLDGDFEHEQNGFREDSFDESLEDTDKTPVVMPEDWRFMNPNAANTDLAETFEDPFDGPSIARRVSDRRSPFTSQEVGISRSDSVRSSGEHRPLPPLPGRLEDPIEMSRLTLNAGMTPKSFRSLPSAPLTAYSTQDESRTVRDSPMPLEEILQSLSINKQSSDAELRSPTGNASGPSQASLETTEPVSTAEVDIEEDVPVVDFRPPSRISRESILRKVQSKQSSFDEGYDDYSFADEDELQDEDRQGEELEEQEEYRYQYADIDPDTPIPSRELNEEHDHVDLESHLEHESFEERNSEGSVDVEDLDVTERAFLHTSNSSEELSASNNRVPELEGREEHDPVMAVHSVQDEQDPNTAKPYAVSILSDTRSTSTGSTASTTSALIQTAIPIMIQPSSRLDSMFGEQLPESNSDHISLPDFTSFLGKADFGLGPESYLLPTFPADVSVSSMDHDPLKVDRQVSPERPSTPSEQITEAYSYVNDDDEEETVSTPESVIHHSITAAPEQKDSPIIPEPEATIKAPGAKLKTRPSATPADIRAMAAARRLVSDEKPLPLLPYEEEYSEAEIEYDSAPSDVEDGLDEILEQPLQRLPSLQAKLDVPLEQDTNQHGLGLEEEFDKVIETQKVQSAHMLRQYDNPSPPRNVVCRSESLSIGGRMHESKHNADSYNRAQRGYVMRQNTKVVVASNRQVSDSNTSVESVQPDALPTTTPRTRGSRKPSGQTWKTEPWNGRARRQSTRRTTIVPERPIRSGPVPPLPDTRSVVAESMDTLADDQDSVQDQDLDGGERGRLFVKVIGVKELELPLPKDERCHFQLTLDNGLHCVTTNWTELGKTAPVGQEFELVVFDDLEFQLTLQTRLKQPKPAAPSIDYSTTQSTKTTKTSKFKNLLRSPQKRRELEQKQRDEDEAHAAMQRQRDIDLKRASYRPTAWDLQHEIVGSDGSFARAYVSLSNHEKQAYGRPYNVDVPCFNEWAVEDKAITSSTRSKLGGIQRRPPYKIGKIELQLLYIPKPRGVQDDEMPRSISAAMRELKEAESLVEQRFEGQLSQQGGDCPFWRRRFFKLQGPKLTAYHESTGQLRATINLSKAIQLIDDHSSLTQNPDPSSSPTKGQGRRKSAFADDEGGYMFVEEGFRVRFANGESIDFYADSRQQKEQWMSVLNETIGKNGVAARTGWTDVVLAKERALKAHAASEKPNQLREEKLPMRGSSKPVPASPIRKPVGASPRVANAYSAGSLPAAGRENVPTSTQQSPPKHWSMPGPRSQDSPGKKAERKQNTRSMMF